MLTFVQAAFVLATLVLVDLTWMVVVGGGWPEGILEFRFGTNLGLRLEVGTKPKNINKRG